METEPHVERVRYMTTLAGYIHWYLTDEKVIGIGDACGMFPIDSQRLDYRQDLMDRFNKLFAQRGYNQKIGDILPHVVVAGESAGRLTETGAKLMIQMVRCRQDVLFAPEGDAATGMVATNSVAPRTGNVSAGTSIFSMIVLEQPIQRVYPEVDIVTTPDGYEVAMIHANNCTSDINLWINLFEEVLQTMGVNYDKMSFYKSF